MAKKYSKKIVLLSAILSFIFGFVVSAFAVVYLSLPDSFVIPNTLQINHGSNGTVSGGDIDVNMITSQELSIHFLELGNKYAGDCTLIKVGNTEILIDAGSRANSVPVIEDYLKQYVTDDTLEFVIVTHAHQDHIAGFGTNVDTDSIFDLFDVETVIQFDYAKTSSKVYQNYCRELADLQTRCHTNVYKASECVDNDNTNGMRFYDLGANVQLEILDQKYYHEQSNNENNHSVCCQIIQNNNKYYLFTGDLEADGEESLVTLNTLHQVELYKAGHHGSKTSSSNTLLNVIQPKNVCVCCCAGSSEYTTKSQNQFPTQDFIDRVAPYTSRVFVTTLCVDYKAGTFTSMNGNIVVYCNHDDEKALIACSNVETYLKDTDWFKNNRTLPNEWKV